MKKYCLAVLSALTVFAGCRTEEQEIPESASVNTVLFRAGMADTRTAFAAPENGVYKTLWTENDRNVLLSLN